MSDRRKEIIAAAATLFRKKGYKAVSMRMLAEEIGIKAASLYNHISSKQELLAEIILSVADRFTAGMTIVSTNDADPLEKIRQIILLHIEITLDDPAGMESLQNNWFYLEGQPRADYKNSRNKYEEDFRQIITSGIASGQLRDLHPELLIYSLLSPLRYLYIWYPRQRDMDSEQLKEEMISVLLRGVIA